MTKLCIFCKHFELDLGQLGYSEVTPGYPGSMRCWDGYFHFDEGCPDYRTIILQAETCKHFKHYNGEVEEKDIKPEVIQPAIRKIDLDD